MQTDPIFRAVREEPGGEGSVMQHTEEVDMILAVLGSQEMVVYGSALLPHMIADGEEVPGVRGAHPDWAPRVRGGPPDLLWEVETGDRGRGPSGPPADSWPGAGFGSRRASERTQHIFGLLIKRFPEYGVPGVMEQKTSILYKRLYLFAPL